MLSGCLSQALEMIKFLMCRNNSESYDFIFETKVKSVVVVYRKMLLLEIGIGLVTGR